MGDCEGGEEDEDGGEFESIVGRWIGIGGEGERLVFRFEEKVKVSN